MENNISQLRNNLLHQKQLCENHKNVVQQNQSQMELHQKSANDIDQNFSKHVNLKVKQILSHEIEVVKSTSRRLDNIKSTTCDMTNVRQFASQPRKVEVNKFYMHQKVHNPFLNDPLNLVNNELEVSGIENLPDPIIRTTINDQPIYNILQGTQNINNNDSVESLIEKLQEAANTFNAYQNALEPLQVLQEEAIRLCNNRKQNNQPEINDRKFGEKIIQLREEVEKLEELIVQNREEAEKIGLEIENSSKNNSNLNQDLEGAQKLFTEAYFNQLLEQESKSINANDLLLAAPNDPKVKELAEVHNLTDTGRALMSILSFGLSIYTAYLLKTSGLTMKDGIYEMLKVFCLSSFNMYLLIAVAVTLLIAACHHLIHVKNRESIINFAKNRQIN